MAVPEDHRHVIITRGFGAFRGVGNGEGLWVKFGGRYLQVTREKEKEAPTVEIGGESKDKPWQLSVLEIVTKAYVEMCCLHRFPGSATQLPGPSPLGHYF